MNNQRTVEHDLWYTAEADDPMTARRAAESFSAKLAKLEGLKTFPAVAQKVLSIFSNPNYKIRDIVTVIQDDPALAASVIKVANSPLFAPIKPINDIQNAIVRLGAKEIRDVVLGVATMSLFSGSDKLGTMVRDHCASTSAVINFFAKQTGIKETGWLFLGALLHDIGKLLMMESLEMDYTSIDENEFNNPFKIHKLERVRLGYDHATLAAHVILSWNFDRQIARLIAWHHDPGKAANDPKMSQAVALLRLSDFTAYQLLHKADPKSENFLQLFDPVEPELELLNLKKEFLPKWWDDIQFHNESTLSVFLS
ncbi:MAG: HDOD domain-containing protein [Deltaproteobacteria bacterium]|nr:HDOD domain-containing protein [Deltaproteobacteria bacterium]